MSTSYASALVKVAAKMTFKVLFFFFLGLLINWVFGFMVLWDLGDGQAIVKTLLMILFFAVFPFIYFWKAKSMAIMTGLQTLYSSSEGFFRTIIYKITGIVVGRMEKTKDSSGLTSSVLSGAVNMAKKSENLPGPIRWIMNFFLNQIPLRDALSEASKEVEMKMDNIEQINLVVFDKVNTYVKDELLDSGTSTMWVLLIINIGVIAATYYFIIAPT